MAEHRGDSHPGELFADRARLFGIAGVVADFEPELPAQHAARGIDVGDGPFCAVLQLRAERGILTGHRGTQADRNVLRHRRTGNEAE